LKVIILTTSQEVEIGLLLRKVWATANRKLDHKYTNEDAEKALAVQLFLPSFFTL